MAGVGSKAPVSPVVVVVVVPSNFFFTKVLFVVILYTISSPHLKSKVASHQTEKWIIIITTTIYHASQHITCIGILISLEKYTSYVLFACVRWPHSFISFFFFVYIFGFLSLGNSTQHHKTIWENQKKWFCSSGLGAPHLAFKKVQ